MRHSQLALVGGRPGLVMAPAGKLALVLAFAFDEDRITAIDVVAEAERLAEVEVGVLEDWPEA
jgi:RNA polymerase sigma-70 factor (ECF subfamily)